MMPGTDAMPAVHRDDSAHNICRMSQRWSHSSFSRITGFAKRAFRAARMLDSPRGPSTTLAKKESCGEHSSKIMTSHGRVERAALSAFLRVRISSVHSRKGGMWHSLLETTISHVADSAQFTGFEGPVLQDQLEDAREGLAQPPVLGAVG